MFICQLDVSALAVKLEEESLFGKYSWRKEKYAHNQMQDIWVRYNHERNIGEKFNHEHSSVWYPVIKEIPQVLPLCMQLMGIVGGERLGGVLITKLPPGGEVKPHVDEGWHAEYYRKYFVPIKNGRGAVFCWEDAVIDPIPGEVWEFDNSVTHWVKNDSTEDRIAMIVCIKTLRDSVNEHC